MEEVRWEKSLEVFWGLPTNGRGGLGELMAIRTSPAGLRATKAAGC